MTESELLRLAASLGARLYDPAYLKAIFEVARRIRDGEKVEREALPWPLS